MKLTKAERSWIMYDWANSAYSLVIVTAILPIYFKAVSSNAGISGVDSTVIWGYTSSAATLVISILAPFLGTIADYFGYKKKIFTLFALSGMITTFGLAIVSSQSWVALLVVYVLSHMGFQGANVFYDGFLVDVTSDERADKISAYGYGLGYIGSALLFVIVMILQVTKGFGYLNTIIVTQLSFVLTALWWTLFSVPFFKNVRQIHGVKRQSHSIRRSFTRLMTTIKDIRQYRLVALFLLAYFFYIDGVDTIFTMATAFGVDMGIDSNHLIIILLVVNLIAFPFTILYGWLSERFGTKALITVAIDVYVLICLCAMFMKTAFDFWILALLVGTSQGGIQALSRSYFAKIIPKDKANEFFGFYNIFGKFSAILGPIIFSTMTKLTGKSQFGIASLMILFIIGGLILLFAVRDSKNSRLNV